MPQPGLHLLLARQKIARWAESNTAPFDIGDARSVNAFLHGTLAPDMGNFPGGSTVFAHAVHTQRTGAVTRALTSVAGTDAERAFAAGWLSHVVADAVIHPLVNKAAAAHSPAGTLSLAEHVRVEVGFDAWFCWQQPLLHGLRLQPAFGRADYGFLAAVLNDLIDVPVTAAALVQMERGLILFSHAALHFAHVAARQLCWGDGSGPRAPLSSAALWLIAARFSPRSSIVHAYLNPRLPEAATIARVEAGLGRVHQDFARYTTEGLAELPDYDLENGSLPAAARRVA